MRKLVSLRESFSIFSTSFSLSKVSFLSLFFVSLFLFLLLTWATKGERKRRKEVKMGGEERKIN